MARIGIIGFGFIARHIVAWLQDNREGLALAFVHNRSPGKLAAIPPAQRCADLADAGRFGADLIVELAHPAITLAHGAAFLAHADYMPLSLTALAEPGIPEALQAAAEHHAHRLHIAAGALVGLDSLRAGQADWAEVSITFRKHPDNIDFADTDIDPASIVGPTIIYDGPVRGIARMFPRNVNTMVACALATMGPDATRARLIADTALTVAIAEVEAIGRSGQIVRSYKQAPAIGVSGTEMAASVQHSIRRASLAAAPGLSFC